MRAFSQIQYQPYFSPCVPYCETQYLTSIVPVCTIHRRAYRDDGCKMPGTSLTLEHAENRWHRFFPSMRHGTTDHRVLIFAAGKTPALAKFPGCQRDGPELRC